MMACSEAKELMTRTRKGNTVMKAMQPSTTYAMKVSRSLSGGVLEEGIVALKGFHDPVHDHDDREAEDRLVESGRRGHAEILCPQERPEHEGVDDVRLFDEDPIVADELIEHVELAAEDAPKTEQDKDHHGGTEHGERDAEHFLELVCPVDGRSLEALLVDARDRGKIEHGAEPDPFPDVGEGEDEIPVAWRGIDIDRLLSQPEEQPIDHPVFVVGQVVEE